MNKEIKTDIPAEILEDMDFEKNIFSSTKTDVMISTFSEQQGLNIILRIYQLLYNPSNNIYEFSQELAAFSFDERSEFDTFLNNLPHLNGLEMLMILNPVYRKKKISYLRLV